MSFVSRRRIRICRRCDLVLALPPLTQGEQAVCPRCQHHLAERQAEPVISVVAWSLTALLLLLLALSFDYVSFSASGVGHTIALFDTVYGMLQHGQPAVALLLSLTMVLLPALYLLNLIYVFIGATRQRPWRGVRFVANTLHHVEPWLMADVFLLGAVVSLVKVADLATITFSPGFWAYAAFAVVVIETSRRVDKDWLWHRMYGELPRRSTAALRIGRVARAQGVLGCDNCEAVVALGTHSDGCPRCGHPVSDWLQHRPQVCMAWLLAALCFFFPAMLLPIMSTVDISGASPSTIVGGVVELWRAGSEPVALVILMASVVIPIAKMIALGWLVWVTSGGHAPLGKRQRMWLYRVNEWIGRWSMIDVFVVAILVALVQAGSVLSVLPGTAALAFAATVICTMFAAHAFDTRRLWWVTSRSEQHYQRLSEQP